MGSVSASFGQSKQKEDQDSRRPMVIICPHQQLTIVQSTWSTHAAATQDNSDAPDDAVIINSPRKKTCVDCREASTRRQSLNTTASESGDEVFSCLKVLRNVTIK